MVKKTHADALKTKQKILDVALELFSKQGYDKTSLSDIARHANVTRGAIYWHFEDKGELLCDLCISILQSNQFPDYLIAATREDEPNPLGCLKQWLLFHASENTVQFINSTIWTVVYSILFSSNESNDKVKERLKELLNSRLLYLNDAIKNAIKKKQLPADCDVELISQFLHIFLIGMFQSIRDNTNGYSKQHFDILVENILNMLPRLTTKQRYQPNYL